VAHMALGLIAVGKVVTVAVALWQNETVRNYIDIPM